MHKKILFNKNAHLIPSRLTIRISIDEDESSFRKKKKKSGFILLVSGDEILQLKRFSLPFPREAWSNGDLTISIQTAARYRACRLAAINTMPTEETTYLRG